MGVSQHRCFSSATPQLPCYRVARSRSSTVSVRVAGQVVGSKGLAFWWVLHASTNHALTVNSVLTKAWDILLYHVTQYFTILHKLTQAAAFHLFDV